MRTCRLIAQFVPVSDGSVAAAKPRQCDEVDLLILRQRADETGELSHDRIIGVIFEHRNHRIIRRVGAGIRIGHDVLGVELVRLNDDETQLFRRDHQFRLALDRNLGHDDYLSSTPWRWAARAIQLSPILT